MAPASAAPIVYLDPRRDYTNPFSVMTAAVQFLEICPRLGPGNYRALARASGVSRQHVARILQGQANPTLPVLQALARAAGIRTAALVEHLESLRHGQEEAAR